MRIGILTHPLDYNYGCLLQAFALQKTLRMMGHEVITINRYNNPYKSFFQLSRNWIGRLIRKVRGDENISLIWNPTESMKTKERLCFNTQKFVDRNIINTGKVFPDELPLIDQKYKFDVYVVGSDQVWLPHFSLNSFLDFVNREDVKRIFYAASSGKESFADCPEIALQCKKLCQKFSAISVREYSLINIAKDYLCRDAIQVLDPTLLLDAQEYLEACVEKMDTSPIVFSYILDKTENKQKLVESIQEYLKLPVVEGSVDNEMNKSGNKIVNHIYPSVDHWILNMNRSKFVVTDSFHGTCMSIIFQKPFVVIGNESRGIERFHSLLQMFGLQDRLITSVDELRDELFQNLPFDNINKILNKKRKESIDFLIRNI